MKLHFVGGAVGDVEIKTWKVWGTGLTVLYIIGKDMDEVLAQGRVINPNYNTVQLYSKEIIK